MRKLREATNRGFESISRAIRLQPDYKSEVSDAYLDALALQVDAKKPANFALTPVSEPGW